MLSHPLDILGLVSHYLTNYLVSRRPVHRRLTICSEEIIRYYTIVSLGYPGPVGAFRRLTTPFAAPPVRLHPEGIHLTLSLDLHA